MFENNHIASYLKTILCPILDTYSIFFSFFFGIKKRENGFQGHKHYIHLFQKTLSERTANGSCRTEIARPKGTVVSILMSSSRGAKLGSLSNHDDDSYTNPTNLHI